MIVRIQASGASFLGAGKYYLHDKLDAERSALAAGGERVGVRGQSDERVWFTDTRNTLNSDPERALEEMWRTAEDQAYLKLQAGVKRGGRTCEDPVKTLSLSWHKDDNPTPEHMIESADAYLKHMGWDGHQALYVGHSDTEHRHIHIILNRVHPENGRTLDDYRDHPRSQAWTLSYEKEQENLRCEERELRAAKREHRAPQLSNDARTNDAAATRRADATQTRAPANDHLPHNVIMLSREHERQFASHERQREAADRDLRAELKAEQRAEREAFFKDGKKEFKALRHAVYDQLRKEYAAEWKEFYTDAKAAEQASEAWSKSSITRALYFAVGGQWEKARAAYNDHDSVREAADAQIAERKADLKARQMEVLRGRQREACDALREQRDVQYQELLLRQRYERGELRTAATLEALGHSPPEPKAAVNQNENENATATPATTEAIAPIPEPRKTADIADARIEHGNAALFKDVLAAVDNALPDERGTVLHPPVLPTDNGPAVFHQLPDLAAGGIGQAASYIADQLGELFAPTPPEVREAQAAAQAKRDAEQREQLPVQDEKTAAYARMIDAAVRAIDEERTAGRDEQFWRERDRGKDWERDR